MDGTKEAKLPADIRDVVFSWSLDDIFNDELYADKVEEITNTFQSVDHYMASFVYPLIEETRSEFCSSIEAIAIAPSCEVVAIKQSNRYGRNSYDVQVRQWEVSGEEQDYKPVPGDVLLLTDTRPESSSDLGRYGRTFALASIIRVEDGGESTTKFAVKASRTMVAVDGMGTSLVATFLLNLTTTSRIWQALGVGDRMRGNLDIIREVLRVSAPIGQVCEVCCHEDMIDDWAGRLSELNESQTDAVLGSVREIQQCEHKPSVKLIWGPPGTGKTKTLSELLWQLLMMKCSVISCAPSNTAVLQVASRLLTLVEARDGRLCHSLGDVLLFGNKRRLKLAQNIGLWDIFLDNRVDKLAECFAPLSGWPHHMRSMTDLLSDCVSQYQIHRENERPNNKENRGVKVEVDSEDESTEFSKFFKHRFMAVAEPLRTFTMDLCTHLPSAFLSREMYDNLVSLLGSIEEFTSLVCHDDFMKIESDIFRNSGDVCDLDFSGMSMEEMKETPLPILLSRARSRCLHILGVLRDSLKSHNYSDTSEIRDLCLESACIVICTCSTSFKLLSKRLFKVLIIDEASQAKECESVIPLQLQGIRHAVLLGDERQLPAVVKSMVSAKAGLGRSLFERLSTLGYPKKLLRIQYRMHPSISAFPNREFYAGDVLDAPNVSCISYEVSYVPGRLYGPYSFINVTDGREERDVSGNSWRNMVEVSVVLKIVMNVCKAANTATMKPSIGIITPYKAQVLAIQKKLVRYQRVGNYPPVKVSSVDGFQGGEEDIIIISTVRSNVRGEIGFLSSAQRTNVALTRARHCLWIIGNAMTLIRSCSVWKDLVKDAEKRGCFFNVDEDKLLFKTVLDIKKELNQIDDSINPDSVLFKNAKWKVLFSDAFKKSFAKIRSDQLKKEMITLLLRLGSGWRPKKYISNVTEDSQHQVMLYKLEELHVIYTIEIMRYSEYMQVLKIWDVLRLNDVETFVKRLNAMFVMYTDEYISLCQMKKLEGNLEVPMTWKDGLNIVQYRGLHREMLTKEKDCGQPDFRTYAENSKVSDSFTLMKFYCLSSQVVRHMISGLDGEELELPFEVTDQEREVVLFRKSSFILGRSGTGKTTVLTVKLIQKQQQHRLSLLGLSNPEDHSSQALYRKESAKDDPNILNENVLRQLFVTVSSKLCSAIKNHIRRLNRFASEGDYFTEGNPEDMHDLSDSFMDFADIPDNFSEIPSKKYPLVITFHKFLMMLDGSLSTSFFRRFPGLEKLPSNEKGYSCSPAFCSFYRQREVSYSRFISDYWPHFNTLITKKLDPSVAYKEIISHIKGGRAVIEARDGILSRMEYTRLSEGRASTIDNEMRELIFDIFLAYEKMKLGNGHFDLSDFVMDLHRRLRIAGGCPGEKMDFVYIDEVQDLTMQQIALFKYVCNNCDEGFVFAGDTAQTIARGIDFRFQDIRSLFYTEYLADSGIVDTDAAKAKGKRVSDLFHLTQNFRTHAGVLRLAQSVVELLYHLFPKSIDRLPPETSLIYGEAPILLECVEDEDLISTIFGTCGDNTGNSNVSDGFGADQVILVRDEASKNEISTQVGKQALVLTIIECKGLEFQDVLLYNFFGTSRVKHQWRVLYGFMESHNLLQPGIARGFPSFDMAKHNVLCSELKQLYVAITRTRQRLWICESETEHSRPMFDYWNSLCLVQTKKLDDSLAQGMRVASSKEEWRARGIKLFKEGNYEMATMCFERAEDTHREKWARAAGLRASATRLLHLNYAMARGALIEAAQMYASIGKPEQEASCYIDLKEYKIAGEIYMNKCGDAYIENAGDCFHLAECWSLAAEAYEKGSMYSKCMSACSKGNLLEMGLNFIRHWKERAAAINPVENDQSLFEITDPFVERCIIHYHRINAEDDMFKAVRTFSSVESARTWLKSHNYLDELILMEEELGNFLEAANIAKLKGDLVVEARMLAKAGDYEHAAKLIHFHIIVNSLWSSGSRGWPLKHFREKDDLLAEAKMLSQKSSRNFHESLLLESEIIADNKHNLLSLVKNMGSMSATRNITVEIFSLRKLLQFHFDSKLSAYCWETHTNLPSKECSRAMLLRNVVSYETLVYLWNLWKENILNMLICLDVGHSRLVDCSSYINFCLEYFGLRKVEFERYIVLIADASWIKQFDVKPLRISGFTYILESQFLSVAKRYWESELVAVGMKVLETLGRLCHMKNLSLFCQGSVILSIYQVSKFLAESESLSSILPSRLRYFLDSTRKGFFEIAFPLDWRQCATWDMFSLRHQGLAVELLTEILDANTEGQLSFGQVGRIMMLLFTCGLPSEVLYQKIVDNLGEAYSSWASVLEKLGQNKGLKQQEHLIMELYAALKGTYYVGWVHENDYISPHCFMYLAGHLLYMASACNQFFYTTKSFLMEAVSSPEYETNPDKLLSWNSCSKKNLKTCYDFLADAIRSILSDRNAMTAWISRSKIHANVYYPLLSLRSVVMFGLVCLNSGYHFYSFMEILRFKHVASKLPEFCECLLHAQKHNFLEKFSGALKTIGDPVVVGSFIGKFQKLPAHSIFVDFRAAKCRGAILEAIIPRSREHAECIRRPLGKIAENPSVSNFPSSGSLEERYHCKDPSVKGKESQAIEKDDCASYESYSSSWTVLDFFTTNEYLEHRCAGTFVSGAPVFEKVVEAIRLLLHTFNYLDQDQLQEDDLSEETNLMLDELKQLSQLLRAEEEFAKKMPSIEDLSARLRRRRANLMEPLYAYVDHKVAKSLEGTSASTPSAEDQSQKGKPKVSQSKGNKKRGGKNKKKRK